MNSRSIYPICVALSEKSADKTIELGRKFPFVEVRLDQGSYTAPEVTKVFKNLRNSVATCRPGKYSDKIRQEFLNAAINAGAKFVDIEIESSAALKKTVINAAKKRKSRSIISYHNFKLTPSKKSLQGIISKARRSGADIVKLATHVRNEKDVKTLLSILSEYEKIVVVGMGEAGKAIRIASPMLGGMFTFASPEIGKETAPGQIAFKTLYDMYLNFGLIKKVK